MSHGAAQPIQPPNDESVTGLQDLQASPEARSIVLCTGQLVGQHEILRDALLFERVKLKAQILVVRANAGVSNKTPALGRGVHGAVFWCKSRCQSLPLKTHPHGDRFGIQAGRRTNPCLKTGPFSTRFISATPLVRRTCSMAIPIILILRLALSDPARRLRPARGVDRARFLRSGSAGRGSVRAVDQRRMPLRLRERPCRRAERSRY